MVYITPENGACKERPKMTQNADDVRMTLAERGHRPNRRYGQNFVIDGRALAEMVAAAKICAGEAVLEIGAGTGVLTALLLAAGARVTASEIDKTLVEILTGRFAGNPDFSLVSGDAMENKHELSRTLLDAVRRTCGGSLKVAANLPYSISTPLVTALARLASPRILSMTLMVQLELAERYAAAEGSRLRGVPSVFLQSRFDVRIVRRVGRGSFWPAPKVDSAIITLTPHEKFPALRDGMADFEIFLRGIFCGKRKTVGNALRSNPYWRVERPREILARGGVDGVLRAEALPLARVAALYAAWRAETERSGCT